MFYVYTIAIPLLIILSFYYVERKIFKINNLLILVFLFWLYYIGLYFLEYFKILDDSWILYSIFFFLFPITIIVLIIKTVMIILNNLKK
jgi:hypothetical protein